MPDTEPTPRPSGLDGLLAFVADHMDEDPPPEGEITYLGVSCDARPYCGADIRGDFRVRMSDDKPTRLGYALDHAAAHGWRIEGRENPLTAQAFCPAHA